MPNRIKGLLSLVALTVVVLTVSGCGTIAEPDKVGVVYARGSIDGFKFSGCIEPGTIGGVLVNDEVTWLPNNLRTWNIAASGGDTNQPITVQSAPEKDQPSGVQVNVWPQTNFMLNTFCGKDDPNSPLVQWWEKLGRRYQADKDQGWVEMLNATVVPALQKATRTVVRGYQADPLVAGTNLPEVQQKISVEFQSELKRLVGADFFCGPTFNRSTGECPPVEVLVKDIDYTDPGIQAARNEKQKAIEAAAAAVAEAEGKVRAAAAQNALYQNQAWLELEKAKLQLQAIQACAGNPNCTLILSQGGTPTIITPNK